MWPNVIENFKKNFNRENWQGIGVAQRVRRSVAEVWGKKKHKASSFKMILPWGKFSYFDSVVFSFYLVYCAWKMLKKIGLQNCTVKTLHQSLELRFKAIFNLALPSHDTKVTAKYCGEKDKFHGVKFYQQSFVFFLFEFVFFFQTFFLFFFSRC